MTGKDRKPECSTSVYGRRAIVSDELRSTVKKLRDASNGFNAIVKEMSKKFGEDES